MADKKIVVSFDDNDVAPPKPKSKWEKFNTPTADLRGNPTMKAATEQLAKDHPWLGGIGNAALDTASAMTSPASLILGAATGGAGALEKIGLAKALPIIHKVMKVGAAGMAGHGTYKAGTAASDLIQGNGKSTPYDLAGGIIEAGLGGLGLRSGGGPKGPAPTGPDYTSPRGLRVAVDALKQQPNLVGPTMEPPKWSGDPREVGHFYSDEPKLHAAIDEHTLQQPKGTIAQEIHGPAGRPDVPVKDTPGSGLSPSYQKGSGKLVSKGLPIVESKKVYEQGLTETGKDVKNSNALELAKGAESKIVAQQRLEKKPLLDLIEAARTRNLTPEELARVGGEIKAYPKGVVAKELLNFKKTAVDAGKAETTAAKMNASDAAANIDVKMGQRAAIDEGLKANADANKPLAKAQDVAAKAAAKAKTQAAAQTIRETQSDQMMEASARKYAAKVAADKAAATTKGWEQEASNLNARDKFTRTVEKDRDAADTEAGKRSDAVAQQTKIDDFLNKEGVTAGPQSVSQSAKGTTADREAQTLRQTFSETPPAKPGEGGAAPAPPVEPEPQLMHYTKAEAVKEANRLGGPTKWNIVPRDQNGVYRLTQRGQETGIANDSGATPPDPSDLPDIRTQISGKHFSKEKASNYAELLGGQIHEDGPRKWSVQFPEADVPVEPQAPQQTDLPKPTPAQEWAAGGPAPSRGTTRPTVSSVFPDEAKVFAKEPDYGGLDVNGYRRMMQLTPNEGGVNWKKSVQTPDEIAEYQDLRKKYSQPKGSISADVTDYTGGDVPTKDVEPPYTGRSISDVAPDNTAVDDMFNAHGDDVDPNSLGLNPQSMGEAPAEPPAPPQGPEFDAFKKKYEDTYKKMMSYGPNQIGASEHANAMAQMYGERPDWAEHIENTLPPEAHEPTVEPYVNPQGEVEPTLPGVEPTINQDSGPVAKVNMPNSPVSTGLNGPEPTTPSMFGDTAPAGPPDLFPQPPEPTQTSVSGAIPDGVYEPTPSLDDARASYERIKAAKEAGHFIPDEVRSSAGEQLQSLERGAAPISQSPESQVKTSPVKPVEVASPPSPPSTEPLQKARQEVNDAMNDPNTTPVVKEMLKRWLDNFVKEHGIKFMPPDDGGGTTLSSFGAGQGGDIRRAFGKLVDAPTEEGPLERFGTALNNLRRNTLLNPYSVAKKGIGDIQSLATAAMHHPERAGDLMRNLMSRDTIENFKQGWNAPAMGVEDDSSMSKVLQNPMNPLGMSGRTMSGLTNATKNVMTSSGFTPEEAKSLTLTATPSRMGTRDLYELLNKPGWNHLDPFSRIGLNWIEQGYEHSPAGLADLYWKRGQLSPEQKSLIMRKAAIGTGVLGASATLTPDNFVKEHPVASRMMTAGPLGPMGLVGMLLNNQTKDDHIPWSEALGSVLKETPGMRLAEDASSLAKGGFPQVARDYLSSYTNFARPLAEALDPEEKDVSSKDLSPFERLTNKTLANVPFVRGTLPAKPEKKPSIKVIF